MTNPVLREFVLLITWLVLCAYSSLSLASVSVEEASALGTTLTPVGAEIAGNADGTIPAWIGGGVNIPESYVEGGHYPDPFADEQPLFEITAANVEQYADKLTAGHLALFKLYPDSFRMKVYPTHRTAKNPDWFYQRTAECAITVNSGADGNSVDGGRACLPFPIPQTAEEIIWNHMLRYGPRYIVGEADSISPDARGRYITDKLKLYLYRAYYDLDRKPDNYMMMLIPKQLAPARVAGDTYLIHDFINPSKHKRQAWKYFAGQRRVRRGAIFAFDTPIPNSGGLQTIDSVDMFNGSLEKYNWTLEGKREVYIGYNAYKVGAEGVKNADLIRPGHINSEYPRYELHRVWVVKATLKKGQRHLYKRREFYLDEDSWQIHICDIYDEQGELWRTNHSYSKYAWNSMGMGIAPGVQVYHDLKSRRYSATSLQSEYKRPYDMSKPPPGDRFFTPASIRKMGVR
ncbi:MAG: DUF1329 domain-containing protein [Pseudomonadales bacterium]